MSADTLDSLLEARAAAAPDQSLYTFLDAQGETIATLTTGALRERARAIAGALTAAGAQGQPVLVCVGPGLEHPQALFGCFYAGATVVPVYPPGDNATAIEAIAAVARASGARWLLAPEALGAPLVDALASHLEHAPRLVPLESGAAVPALPGAR
ncbi:MAG TPA: AMP-binding protein, partial [Oscillatoriaceae cyanobacterium]